jgi:hypothetical protein
LVFQNPESARSSLVPVAPARSDAGDQLLTEALDPLLRVRRPVPEPDVQRLAGVRARGEDRVVAEDPGVPVGGALLAVATDLADEAVDIDHQPSRAGTGPGLPRARQRLGQQLVQLAHVPEREGAQERPERRRRRDPASEQPASTPGPEHVDVIDAVCAEHHREDQCHHLAARVRGARPIAPQPHQPPRERLDSQALGKRGDQHHAGVRDDPLIVELNPQAVQSDGRVMVHHEGDLLTAGPGCPTQPQKPCSGGHSSSNTGRNPPTAPVDPGSYG